MILLSAAAQADNLGDAILRSVAVEWLSDAPDLRVSVGSMPPGYIDIVDPERNHVTAERERVTVRRLLSSRRPILVFAPGEQMLTNDTRELMRQALGILVSAAVRVRRGRVIKLPRGYRGRSRRAIALERVQLALCNLAWTRDGSVGSLFPALSTLPDVAIVSSRLEPKAATDHKRDQYVLSLRSDRAARSAPEFARLADAARASFNGELSPLVVVQVARDDAAAEAIAGTVGAARVKWCGDHALQLDRVLAAYDRSRFVISDRLHVLLFAARRGALPVGFETGQADKLRRQLGPYGLAHLVLDPAAPVQHLLQILGSYDDHLKMVRQALARATLDLESARADVRSIAFSAYREGRPNMGRSN